VHHHEGTATLAGTHSAYLYTKARW